MAAVGSDIFVFGGVRDYAGQVSSSYANEIFRFSTTPEREDEIPHVPGGPFPCQLGCGMRFGSAEHRSMHHQNFCLHRAVPGAGGRTVLARDLKRHLTDYSTPLPPAGSVGSTMMVGSAPGRAAGFARVGGGGIGGGGGGGQAGMGQWQTIGIAPPPLLGGPAGIVGGWSPQQQAIIGGGGGGTNGSPPSPFVGEATIRAMNWQGGPAGVSLPNQGGSNGGAPPLFHPGGQPYM